MIESDQHSQKETIRGINKIQWLWETGAELYRTKWIRDWGDCPTEMLESLLSKLSAEQIKLGFGECIKMAQSGNEWPPVPIIFISMCKVAGIDYQGSFDRCIRKEPAKDEAEKRTRQDVGFNVRALPNDKAFRLWKGKYEFYYLQQKEGKLKPIEAPMLTEYSQVKDTDIMRDNFVPETTASARIMDRMNKIRKKF